MNLLRCVSFLALAACALVARANVVTFDTTAPFTGVGYGSLDIEGLNFAAPSYYEFVYPNGNPGANDGTQVLVYGATDLLITQTGGGAFRFSGFDYGQSYYANTTSPISVTLNLVGGGSLVYGLTSTPNFQTFRSDALVTSVVIGPNSVGYVAIDNVVFSPISSAVPGPMAALPFALIALRRRKRG